jgi:hypothetical protein
MKLEILENTGNQVERVILGEALYIHARGFGVCAFITDREKWE